MSNSFFKSYHCESRFHCKSCRDIDNDRFREKLYEAFDDIEEVNFECPYGVPWGATQVINSERFKTENSIKRLTIDVASESRDQLSVIDGVSDIFKNYDDKINKDKCTSCLKSRLTRGLNKCIVNFLVSYKNLSVLEGFDEDYILSDGRSNRTIAEWKKEINEQLSSN